MTYNKLNKRKLIRKNVKLKIFKSKITEKEKQVVNVAVILIIFAIALIFKGVTTYNAKFYNINDIANFNIDTKTIVNIKSVAKAEKIEFEKLLVMYSKDNNYFSKGSYVKEFSMDKNKLLENIKFEFFTLSKEDNEVYKMVKSFNNDIKCLPIKKDNFKDVACINSFDTNNKNYSTIFIERDSNVCNIDVVSITDGNVESVLYNGENGLTVTIVSESGNKYIYANLNETKVKVGSSVKSGKVIGVMGNSKQVKDEISSERCKLKVFAIHNFNGKELYFNIYPILVTKN